jgi:hypothetical protein
MFELLTTKNNLIILDAEKFKKLLDIDDARVTVRTYSFNGENYLRFYITASPGDTERDILREEKQLVNRIKPLIKKIKIGEDNLFYKMMPGDEQTIILNSKYKFLVQD